jgi:hypothetical protein
MDSLINSLVAGVISGSVISAILGLVFHRRTAGIEEEIRTQFQKSLDVSRSRRAWKEESLAELLGPIYMQLDRTERAFNRWTSKNLYLEAKIIREGNLAIRDLLLQKGHLIPPELLDDAGRFVEHYDRWLEEFEQQRLSENPDLDTPFTFVGPAGYPFPVDAEERFREAFSKLWHELYGAD